MEEKVTHWQVIHLCEVFISFTDRKGCTAMLVEKWQTWLLESNWCGKRCHIEMRKIMHHCFTQSLLDIGISSKWLEERVLSHWKNAQKAGKYVREAESIYRYLGANENTRARIKRETSLCHCVNPRWKHSLNIMGNSGTASWTFLSMHCRSSSFEKGKEQKSTRDDWRYTTVC